jgi:type II secretory pathway pseudopilin PulG
MVEILVAISLFALLAAATVPLLITATRASVIARLDTGAKNLSQQRFEQMRNLPFRIAYDPIVTTSRDLLDTYYPNLTAPPGGITTQGYVTTQPRRAGEPSTGPFFRTVFTTSLGNADYTQYVATQFLVPETKAPIAPSPGYNAFSLSDSAPSPLVQVTVTTEWQAGPQSKILTVQSQISDVAASAPLLNVSGRVSALEATSTIGSTSTTDLSLEAGVVNLDAGIGSGTTAAVSAQGAAASLTPGTRVDGARQNAQAPPDSTATTQSDPTSHDLLLGADLLARIPKTDAAAVLAKTAGGLPTVGTISSPVTATAYGSTDLLFGNRPNLPDSALGLREDLPVLWMPANGGTVQARASASAAATAGAAHYGGAELKALTSFLRVLPTDYAPAGLVQTILTDASISCSSDGSSVTSSVTYTGYIRFWRYTPADPADPLAGGSSGYTSWMALGSSQASDPLAGVSLATDSTGWPVARNGGRLVYLGELIESMSSQTAGSLAAARVVSASGKGSETRVPAMISIATVPLRAGESLSTVKTSLGVVTCAAEDNR